MKPRAGVFVIVQRPAEREVCGVNILLSAHYEGSARPRNPGFIEDAVRLAHDSGYNRKDKHVYEQTCRFRNLVDLNEKDDVTIHPFLFNNLFNSAQLRLLAGSLGANQHR